MWRELIERLYPDHEFGAGATPRSLAEAELRLGVSLPPDLRELLTETDGVVGSYGLGLVWPVSRIVEDNLAFRSQASFRDLYMPFDSLLFFADAGNGDQFAFRLISVLWDRYVYVWNHENDSRTWVAPSLSEYLERWSDGRIAT
jgi:cell wall assembly regulator SMI1